MGWLSGIIAAIPAAAQILGLVDKWVTKTPAQRAVSDLNRQVQLRKKLSSELNEAIKNARKSHTKRLEDILNRR